MHFHYFAKVSSPTPYSELNWLTAVEVARGPKVTATLGSLMVLCVDDIKLLKGDITTVFFISESNITRGNPPSISP